MRDLVFPARKKYARLMLGPCSEAHFEAYTKSELKGHFITRLNGVELDGGAMNHYLIQGKKQNMEELHSSLELPEPVWKHIKSVPVIRRRNSPKIMAVANATPDSFFSGSRVNAEPQALQKIVDSGPDIIDIGGESTRPGSGEVSIDEEINRLKPVIQYFQKNSGIPLSLDTRHYQVLEEFAGHVTYINDISGFREKSMIRLALDHGLKCITMHMRGDPKNMQTMTEYTDLFPEVLGFLLDSAENLRQAGIRESDIFLDPGIGFAKGLSGNLELIRDAGSFNIGYGTLFGTSRKSFLGKITGRNAEERLSATLATTAYLASEGIDILRVHDIKENLDAVKVISKILELGN